MKLPTDKDFAYGMTLLKIVSWPVGTWPLQEYNFATGLRSVVTLILLLLLIVILPTEIYLDFGNAEQNIEAVVMISCTMLAIVKVASFRFHPAGLIANFVSAAKDYQELNGEESRAIVKRHAQMSRMLTSVNILFLSYFSATRFVILTMDPGEEDTKENFNETGKVRLNYPIPSDYTMALLQVSDSMHVIIYIGEFFLMFVLGAGNLGSHLSSDSISVLLEKMALRILQDVCRLGSDTLFFGITFHLCGQVEVLKLDFSRFLDDKENSAKRFNALIERHHHLLALFDHLNDTIGSILVLQLISSCLLICITGFQFILSLHVHNVVMLMKTFTVVNTLLTQLFAYSYVGEYSKNQFEGIGQLIYSSDWYNAPCNLSKNIVFVLMKTQSPVHLKAGRFFVMNLETYMSILKTSMSYLSVLRVMITE